MASSSVDIRLISEKVQYETKDKTEPKHLVTPGNIITRDTGFMRGHGTYIHNDVLYSSVAGVIERVNKLVTVRSLNTRYHGDVGDVVVGRITELQNKRWKVDTNSRLDSVLLLSSVNLPGGELRRRSAEDALSMRDYLKEGDLISAEVQSVFQDGSLSLHTRSLKYGKLSQGVLTKISPSLVKRMKNHFHNLPCGASVIVGNNGFVWISPFITEENKLGGYVQNLEEEVCLEERQVIARLRNVIGLLSNMKMMVYDTSIMYGYEESMKYEIVELLKPEVMHEVATMVRNRFELEILE